MSDPDQDEQDRLADEWLAEHHPDTLQRYGHFVRDRLSSEDVRRISFAQAASA